MDDVEAFARARRRKLRVRLFVLGAVIAAPFVYLGWRFYSATAAEEARREARRAELELSAAERASLRTAIADARRRLAAAREGWARAVTPEALAAAGPDSARCGVRVVGPTPQAAARYARYGSIDANYYGNAFLRRHATGEPIPPLDIDMELKQLDQVAAELEAGTADRDDASRVHGLEDTSLFVVVDRETRPFVRAGITEVESYTPGRLIGSAYVYSHREQRIVCAGDFDVTNGPSVEFSYQYMADNILDKEAKMQEAAMATLRRDLDVRVQQAVAGSLRAVEPGAPGDSGAAPGGSGAAPGGSGAAPGGSGAAPGASGARQ